MAVLSRRETSAPVRATNKEALVTATLSLLAEGSAYAEISIEQIVKRAGLSRPTFYSHFKDKRALILELGLDLQRAVAEAADPWLALGEGRVRDTLAAVLTAFTAHREVASAIAEAATYDDEVNAFWHTFHDRFMVIARDRIVASEPNLDPARAKARAFALVWMTERTVTEYLAGSDVEEGPLLDELAAFWNNALGTPPQT